MLSIGERESEANGKSICSKLCIVLERQLREIGQRNVSQEETSSENPRET